MGILDWARPNLPDPEDGTGIWEDASACLLFLVLGGILTMVVEGLSLDENKLNLGSV